MISENRKGAAKKWSFLENRIGEGSKVCFRITEQRKGEKA